MSTDNHYCKTCHNVLWETTKLGAYNLYCKTLKKYIAKGIFLENRIVVPSACPLNGDNFFDALKWKNLTPTTPWSEIKVNEIYHIPPYLGEKRCDVKVTFKCSYYFIYTKLGSNEIKYAYASDIVPKIIVKPKKKN